MLDLDNLLRDSVRHEASDVHIKVGSPPYLRIDGHLQPWDREAVTPADTERIAFALLPKTRADEFLDHHEADFAYTLAGLGRFRVNVMRQRGSVGLVLRRVLPGIPSMEDLGLPPVIRRLSEERRGLVLVDRADRLGEDDDARRDDRPHQRHRGASHRDDRGPDRGPAPGQEVDRQPARDRDRHRRLRQRAASAVLRQDPDVILIGEMRDPETVWAALSAAETGHLVFSTLHTMGAVETITRIIDFFPPFQQQQVRMSVATSLKGIISQRLLERADHNGRVPAMEVMVSTGRVFDKIADASQTHDLEEIIADGEFYGMQTFDQSLLHLYEQGIVNRRDALGDGDEHPRPAPEARPPRPQPRRAGPRGPTHRLIRRGSEPPGRGSASQNGSR